MVATIGYLFLARPKADSEDPPPAPHFYVLAAIAFLAWAIGTSSSTAALFGIDGVTGALLLGAATLLIPMLDGLASELLPTGLGGRRIPEGQLWGISDHRSNSSDSRVHGPVGVDDVIGKASVIVWPLSRVDLLDDPDIQADAAARVPQGDVSGGLLVGAAYPAARRRRSLASSSES